MITGFNTDVRHGDVVFHVQTEDKGTGNPCIESLVYVGGQILARKRAGYRSLLASGEASKVVTELMERQHRSMIQQIRAGEMDDKVAAIKGAGGAGAAAPAKPSPSRAAQPEPSEAPPRPAAPQAPTRPVPVAPVEPPPRAEPQPVAAATAAPAPNPAPARKPPPRPPVPPSPSPPRPRVEPKPSPVPPARPHPPRPSRGRPEVAESSADRTLDQVILEYLEMESDQNRLLLTMTPREGEVAAGKEATLHFRTESSFDRDPIGEAIITVRLISTIDEPQVLARGLTNDRGELMLEVAIPDLRTGSGALIISAESSIGNAETRHLI